MIYSMKVKFYILILHLAPEPELTTLLRHKVVGIAYETVRGQRWS